MQITVKSYHEVAALTAGLPDGRLELPDDTTVAEALLRLAVPADKAAGLALFVNGRPASLHSVLGAGDTLVFFTPIAGG